MSFEYFNGVLFPITADLAIQALSKYYKEEDELPANEIKYIEIFLKAWSASSGNKKYRKELRERFPNLLHEEYRTVRHAEKIADHMDDYMHYPTLVKIFDQHVCKCIEEEDSKGKIDEDDIEDFSVAFENFTRSRKQLSKVLLRLWKENLDSFDIIYPADIFGYYDEAPTDSKVEMIIAQDIIELYKQQDPEQKIHFVIYASEDDIDDYIKETEEAIAEYINEGKIPFEKAVKDLEIIKKYRTEEEHIKTNGWSPDEPINEYYTTLLERQIAKLYVITDKAIVAPMKEFDEMVYNGIS